MCFCSWPTCRHGRLGNCSLMLYRSMKYLATVHSTVCPESNCSGKLKHQRHSSAGARQVAALQLHNFSQTNTHDCVWAGRRVTLHTRYFLRMAPAWVISTLSPLISLVNLTRCESVSGRRWSFMSPMSSTCPTGGTIITLAIATPPFPRVFQGDNCA